MTGSSFIQGVYCLMPHLATFILRLLPSGLKANAVSTWRRSVYLPETQFPCLYSSPRYSAEFRSERVYHRSHGTNLARIFICLLTADTRNLATRKRLKMTLLVPINSQPHVPSLCDYKHSARTQNSINLQPCYRCATEITCHTQKAVFLSHPQRWVPITQNTGCLSHPEHWVPVSSAAFRTLISFPVCHQPMSAWIVFYPPVHILSFRTSLYPSVTSVTKFHEIWYTHHARL